MEREGSDVLIGRTRHGHRFYLSVRTQSVDSKSGQTVDHEPVPENGVRLSMSGVTIRRGGSIIRDGDWLAAGQNVDDMREIVTVAPGLTACLLAELVDIWDRSHLNDMSALCIHQTMPEKVNNRLPDAWWELVPPCPETGYKAGSAWLYRDATADVARVWEILEPLTGSK